MRALVVAFVLATVALGYLVDGHEQRAKFFEGFLQESLGTPNAERPDEP